MGVYSYTKRLLKALTNQAVTSDVVAYLTAIYTETEEQIDYLVEVEGVEMTHGQALMILRPLDFAIAQQRLAQQFVPDRKARGTGKNAKGASNGN